MLRTEVGRQLMLKVLSGAAPLTDLPPAVRRALDDAGGSLVRRPGVLMPPAVTLREVRASEAVLEVWCAEALDDALTAPDTGLGVAAARFRNRIAAVVCDEVANDAKARLGGDKASALVTASERCAAAGNAAAEKLVTVLDVTVDDDDAMGTVLRDVCDKVGFRRRRLRLLCSLMFTNAPPRPFAF